MLSTSARVSPLCSVQTEITLFALGTWTTKINHAVRAVLYSPPFRTRISWWSVELPWEKEKEKSSILSNTVTGTWPHGHILLSPLEPIFTFTTNTPGTNVSIHSFCHFLLLSTKAYETSQKPTHLFHSIYLFVLIFQRIKKNPKELTYSTTPSTPAKFDVQKNSKHILKTTEVSEKFEFVLQGELVWPNTTHLLFQASKLCGEQTTIYKQVAQITKIVWLETCTLRNQVQGMKKFWMFWVFFLSFCSTT